MIGATMIANRVVDMLNRRKEALVRSLRNGMRLIGCMARDRVVYRIRAVDAYSFELANSNE